MRSRSKITPALVAVMAMTVAACGSATEPTQIDLGAPSAEATVPPSTDASTTEASPQATTETTSGTPATTAAPRQRPEGPDASDFELALGGPGGTFSLSAETRPTFLVFWAEW